MENSLLKLKITARQHTTLLPRCLQILSRRGFILEELHTRVEDTHIILSISLMGPTKWHAYIPNLLARLYDIDEIEVIT